MNTCFFWQKRREKHLLIRQFLGERALNNSCFDACIGEYVCDIAIERRQTGRETARPWSLAKHRASLSCREMFQQTLMVFLVNSRHNESFVPPTEFLLSTPTVVILKSVESSFLLFSMSALFPSLSFSVDWWASLSSFFFYFISPSFFLSPSSLSFLFCVSRVITTFKLLASFVGKKNKKTKNIKKQ